MQYQETHPEAEGQLQDGFHADKGNAVARQTQVRQTQARQTQARQTQARQTQE